MNASGSTSNKTDKLNVVFAENRSGLIKGPFPMIKRVVGTFVILLCFQFTAAVSVTALDTERLTNLIGQKAVAISDGFEFLMTLMQIEELYPGFDSQKNFLIKAGIIPSDQNSQAAQDPLTRGKLAYALVKTLRLKGGLKARLLGMNERFAMEELLHQNIMRPGHRQDFMTGDELVVVMTNALNFMAMRNEKAGPVE